MPVMDGFTAVRRIRQWEREHQAERTPIIALTASAFDETVRKAIEAGCDSHLGKPLKRSTLLRVIRETALARRERFGGSLSFALGFQDYAAEPA